MAPPSRSWTAQLGPREPLLAAERYSSVAAEAVRQSLVLFGHWIGIHYSVKSKSRAPMV